MAARNYIHRRNHKERAQPEHRKRLGFLEKHRDYVERARSHHIKRDKLQRLQQKAAERNPDEFYRGMVGRKTERGVHVASRGNEALDSDVVALLKTQDAGYLRKQLVTERKRLTALVEEIAPRVPGIRLSYLEKKPEFVTALRRAELLGDVRGTDAMASSEGRRVAGFGKKTLWVDGVDALQQAAKAARTNKEKPAPALTAADKLGEVCIDAVFANASANWVSSSENLSRGSGAWMHWVKPQRSSTQFARL
jgi:hypothetical protein